MTVNTEAHFSNQKTQSFSCAVFWLPSNSAWHIWCFKKCMDQYVCSFAMQPWCKRTLDMSAISPQCGHRFYCLFAQLTQRACWRAAAVGRQNVMGTLRVLLSVPLQAFWCWLLFPQTKSCRLHRATKHQQCWPRGGGGLRAAEMLCIWFRVAPGALILE